MDTSIIIIGTGLAGYQVAREFRKIDPTTNLTLLTLDNGQFYPKPQLSTAKTVGKSANGLITANAQEMASQLNATILTNTIVNSIDPHKKIIDIRTKKLPYQKLILAVGAEVITPPLIGNAVDRVLSINHLYHYLEFEERIKDKKKIGILGAGLIGCEFANDLSNANYEVHIIAPAKAPLDLLIPDHIGFLLQQALEKNGVSFHLECVANRIDHSATGYALQLSNGEILEVDVVLSAIGLKPHTTLAASAGIKINRGILVNRFLETSVKDIYALGDCAEVEGHILPYIAPMLHCAKALAQTLSGKKTAVLYPAMPIVVKTPAHPIAVCPPPQKISGRWDITMEDHNAKALFYNDQGELYGFVLTNDAVKERHHFAKQIPCFFDMDAS